MQLIATAEPNTSTGGRVERRGNYSSSKIMSVDKSEETQDILSYLH